MNQTITITNKHGLTTTVTETGIVTRYKGVTLVVNIGDDIQVGDGFNAKLEGIHFSDDGTFPEIIVRHYDDNLRYIYGAHQVSSLEPSIHNPALHSLDRYPRPNHRSKTFEEIREVLQQDLHNVARNRTLLEDDLSPDPDVETLREELVEDERCIGILIEQFQFSPENALAFQCEGVTDMIPEEALSKIYKRLSLERPERLRYLGRPIT